MLLVAIDRKQINCMLGDNFPYTLFTVNGKKQDFKMTQFAMSLILGVFCESSFLAEKDLGYVNDFGTRRCMNNRDIFQNYKTKNNKENSLMMVIKRMTIMKKGR